MQYKYETYIKSISNCPPSNCQSKEINGFRFVFEDLQDQRNFQLVYIIKPARRNSNDSGANVCSGYALSFFNSLDNAKKRYNSLLRNSKNLYKSLGTHIATGLIASNDGVITPVSESGHFDLHEFENTDIKTKFTIIEKVYHGKSGSDKS